MQQILIDILLVLVSIFMLLLIFLVVQAVLVVRDAKNMIDMMKKSVAMGINMTAIKTVVGIIKNLVSKKEN